MEETKNDLESAISLHQNNKQAEAEKIYLDLLKTEPDNLDTIYFYGLLLYQTSRFNEALVNFKKILEFRPEGQILIDILNLTAEIYLNKGNIDFAEKYFMSVLDEDSFDFTACYNLGRICFSRKDYNNAERYYLRASESDRSGREIYDELLKIYTEKNDTDKIINCLNKLIEFDSSNPQFYFELGKNYFKKGDVKNTHNAYANAIRLKPDFVAAYINIGMLFHRINDFKNAEQYLIKGLELNDNFVETYVNLGNVYVDTGETKKVFEISNKGLKKKPGNAYLLFNIARANFLEGNIDKGWEYFKHRRIVSEKKHLKNYLLDYSGSLKNKKVLVYWDSGYGDSLQFLRYIPLLKEKCMEVLLKIQEPLRSLVEYSNLGADILPANQKLEETEYDFQINLTSLSYLFKTDKNNIPFKDKYITVSPDKINLWKEQYFDNNDFKIGIVWHSHANTFRKNIENVTEFYNISKIPGVKLYSLQQTCGNPLLENLPEDLKIINLGDEFKDFSDTAAVIENLDLLIAIDTASVHLAGALGKPVYCMLPDIPNWRWFMHGETCPWYESMKLFRQKTPGNWKEVIEGVQKEVELFF